MFLAACLLFQHLRVWFRLLRKIRLETAVTKLRKCNCSNRPRASLISSFVCGFCLFMIRDFCICGANLPFVKIQNAIYSRWNVTVHRADTSKQWTFLKALSRKVFCGLVLCFLSRRWLLDCGAYCAKSTKLSLCSLRWARETIQPKDPPSFACWPFTSFQRVWINGCFLICITRLSLSLLQKNFWKLGNYF